VIPGPRRLCAPARRVPLSLTPEFGPACLHGDPDAAFTLPILIFLSATVFISFALVPTPPKPAPGLGTSAAR